MRFLHFAYAPVEMTTEETIMLVNGQKKQLKKETALSDFLKSEGYDLARVAVEKNGVIVPKKNFETEILTDKDKIEVVCFVGGG